MTLQEFNTRTGWNLSQEQYEPIEKMYLEAGNIQKDDFCSDFVAHHDSTLLNEFYVQSESLKEQIDSLRDERAGLAIFLIEQAEKWSALDLRDKAIEMLGEKKYLFYKIQKGYDLWAKDRELLAGILRDDIRYNK